MNINIKKGVNPTTTVVAWMERKRKRASDDDVYTRQYVRHCGGD